MGALLLATPLAGVAAPLHVARMDGLHGDPVDRGPFALYWNPAGLATPGMSLGAHGLLAMRRASYDRDAALNDVAPEEAAANAGEATIDTMGFIPALAFRHGFAEVGGFQLGYGVAGFVPFAGVANWARHPEAPAETPGAYDGPQRWATIHSRLVFVAASAGFGASHRATGLSLGAAPTLYHGSLATVRARNVDRTDDLWDVSGHLKEGRIVFEGDDTRLGFTVGLRWDASERFSLAYTWQQVPEFKMEGEAQVAYGTADPFDISAVLAFPLPDFHRLGASIGVGGFTLRPYVEFAQWSVMKRQVARSRQDGQSLIEIERAFDDVWAFKLRADTPAWSGLRGTFGGGFETAATPEKTHEPGLAEGENVEASLGLEYTLPGGGARFALATTLQTFFARDVENSIQKPTTNGRYTDDRLFSTLDVEVPF